MDSYTFSSDSTSSFFVKETTSDDNVVDMDNIADSIIQLNATNEIGQVANEIASADIGSSSSQSYSIVEKGDSDYGHVSKATGDSNQVFVITIGDTSSGSGEQCQPEKSDSLSLHHVQMPVNQFNAQNDDNEMVDDDDHFDMEQFISTKVDKPVTWTPITVAHDHMEYDDGKDNVEKYFTECGSNSVKCNLCSDVLLSNRPNLVLHLRHVHKYDKREANFGKVWKLYTKIDSFKAKCNLCSECFVYRNRMSTLIKHLQAVHKNETESDVRCAKQVVVDGDGAPTEQGDGDGGSTQSNANASPSDVIVIQNSHGKLLNQIKVNKSWKCFTKLPNSDKMICNLCKKIFTHKETNDLLHHLHEEHKSLLSIKQEAAATRDDKLLDSGIGDGDGTMKETTSPPATGREVKAKGYDGEKGGSSSSSMESESTRSVIVQKVGRHSMRGRSLKTSKIWEYFTDCRNDKVECTLCNKVLANNYSTSNLLRHLNARHKEAYNAVKELAATDTETIKIVIKNEKGQLENDVSVADMLEDYKNLLTSNEDNTLTEDMKAEAESRIGSNKIRQQLSGTWRYFTKVKMAGGKVKCNLCNAILSYSNGVSSNLTRHLKLKHKGLHEHEKEAGNESEENGKDKKERSIETSDMTTLVIVTGDDQTNEPNDDVSTKEALSDTTMAELTLDTIDDDHCNEKTIAESNQAIGDDRKPTDYFKRTSPHENSMRTCILCSTEIELNKNSTYRLARHLKLKHGLSFKRTTKPRKMFAYDSDTSDVAPNKDDVINIASTCTVADSSSDLLSDSGGSLNKSNSEGGKVTGRTWKHFTKLDREKAKCNLCGHVLTYKLGQTSNLIKHIELSHQDVDSSRSDSSPVKMAQQATQDKDSDSEPSRMFENSIHTVWKYFTKLEDSKAMCNLCEFPNIFSHPEKSKSHLVKHLNRKHRHLLNTSDDDNVSIQMPDVAYLRKRESRDNEMRTSNYCEFENEEVEENYDQLQDMKSLYEYLIADEKLKRCIKFENNQIKCKVCSGSFVCDNLINYEYTIRYHVQIFHAEWTVMCFDENFIKRECLTPIPSDHDPDAAETATGTNYNELEAIANEVNSFIHCHDQDHDHDQEEPMDTKPLIGGSDNDHDHDDDYGRGPIEKNKNVKVNKKIGVATLSDEIWKYFTKLTSQNVRCNFCSILLSFRQHKKWNLVRHLKLKHKSKINASLLKKQINVKSTKRQMNVHGSVKSVKSASSLTQRAKNKQSKQSDVCAAVKKIGKETEETSGIAKSGNFIVKKKSKSKGKSRNEVSKKKPILPSLFNSPINRKIGRTWSHFTKMEMGKAQCNICNQMLLYRGTGIDLLNDHLTSKHSSFFDGSSQDQSEPKRSYTKKIHFDSKSSESSSEDSDVEEKKPKTSIAKRKSLQDEEFLVTTPKQNVKQDEEEYGGNRQGSRVWQYFTRVDDGYAKCQLCLSEMSYRGATSNLMRHLQKIHSVISLLTPDKEKEKEECKATIGADEMVTEQSRLLAAVDLTPTKLQVTKHVCYVRLTNNLVRCNFCPRVLYHKSGNMHKLMSHILYKHRQETKKYKSTKNLKFLDIDKEIILTVNEKPGKEKLTTTSKPKMDNRKVFRSNTWLYFTKLNDQYARCNICSNAFSFKGGSIYNLTRHLLIKHDVKLIKRHEMPYKKLVNLPTPKYTSYKKRSETLSFYKKINRDIVRCKLCMKRFVYKGLNTKTLVSHLWSNHIKKLIETSGNALNFPHNDQYESDSFGLGKHSEDKYSTNCDEVTRNDVSNYFTELDDGDKNLQCNVCQKVFSLKSASLTSLSQHLEDEHNIEKSLNPQDYMDSASAQQIYGQQPNDKQDKANCLLTDIDQNEIYVYFLKSNNREDQVQCKFCDHVLKRDNVLELKTHLISKHEINDFLSINTSKTDETCFTQSTTDSSSNILELKSNIEKLGSIQVLRMKCKLCYKEVIVKKNNALSCLIQHLKAFHNEELDKEREFFCRVKLNVENGVDSSAVAAVAVSEESDTRRHCKKEEKRKMGGLKYLVFNHFKNMKSYRNKCAVCCKFISAKRSCNHHITNDLSVRYSVRNVKRRRVDGGSGGGKEMKVDDEDDGVNVKERKSVLHSTRAYCSGKVRHCMSVNSNDNKCYECMVSQYNGYCIHSLNQMLTNEYKKKYGNGKLNSEYNNQVSLNSDEVQIIADSLNGCSENNIIIITDNEDTSVLNYDLANRNEKGSQDSISYHIMNSINEIDDDDIKVIIYNYNSEEGAAAGNEQADHGHVKSNSVKIEQVAENRPALGEALDLNSIVNELHNSNSEVTYSNENDGECSLVKDNSALVVPDVELETQEPSDLAVQVKSASDTGKIESEKCLSEPPSYQKSYDLEKLTELAEVSCNEQFYKRNSLLNNIEERDDSVPEPQSEPEPDVPVIRPGGTSRCIVENIYPENDMTTRMAIEKDYVTSNVVYKSVEVESCTDEIPPVLSASQLECEVHIETETGTETLPVVNNRDEQPSPSPPAPLENDASTKHSQVFSEDVINAIFNEVIVNLQEPAEEKQVSLIKLRDDDIEVPSGLFLQDLKNLYKINRLVLSFINIDYKYKTAKCNLCKMYLELSEPIIYNLLMHLFGQHKEKVCTEEPVNKPTDKALDGTVIKQRKKSPVWKYFINERNFRANCKICNFSFSYKGGAINNLSRHLRLRHNITVSSKCVDNSDFDISYLVTYPKRRSCVKLRSKTWNYFSKEPNDWAKCRICKKYLSYRSSTINNLTRHLRTIHSKIFNSLFTDKEPPMFIKNEDGTLSENSNFMGKDENGDIYSSLLETSTTKSRDEILQQCSYSSVENNRRKSIVWNYFTELSTNCGKCNFCSKVISCKGGGTSNLSRHLRSRHGIWIVLTSNLSQTFSETMNDPEVYGSGGATSDLNDTIITQEQLHILKNRKLVHKKSKTWEYFTKETADRVRCNLCSKPLSYKCKAVHNLRRHLAKKHPSCVVKPDPIRLKLQINTENDVLHNSNEMHNLMQDEADKKFIDITDTSVVIVDEETQLPPHRPDRNVRPKKSIVWNYFEELEYGIAKCLICAKVLSFRGGGTNNLMRHLRCRHSIIILSQTQTVDFNSLAECDTKSLPPTTAATQPNDIEQDTS